MRNTVLLSLICTLTPTTAWADWGENWSELVWGATASPVPSLPALWLVLASALTGAALVLLLQRNPRVAAVLLALALLAPLGARAGVSLPHLFTNGTIADANEVNQNFALLELFSNRFGGGTQSGATSISGPGACATRILGEVWQYAGTIAPQGSRIANGQILSIAQNSSLFSILGTRYGGDGSMTFALPDLADVAPDGVNYVICLDGVFPSGN